MFGPLLYELIPSELTQTDFFEGTTALANGLYLRLCVASPAAGAPAAVLVYAIGIISTSSTLCNSSKGSPCHSYRPSHPTLKSRSDRKRSSPPCSKPHQLKPLKHPDSAKSSSHTTEMEGQHLVLRLRASSGHSRVTCNSSITASELYVQVAQQLKVPEDTLDLYTDAAKKQLLPRAACCVESLGLSSGCLLFVDTRGSNAVVRHSATLFTPSHSLKDVALDIPPAEEERDYAVLDLPLVNSFTATKLQAGHMNKLPQTLTLKHQVYRHVDHLELMNVSEVQQFVSYWKNDLNMQQQRCGFMFGYYREDRHYPLGIRAVCEAVYEPPQEGTEDEFRLLEGHASEMELAAAVAARLGLELIGFVFTHKPRKQLLTPKEVLFLAKLSLLACFEVWRDGTALCYRYTRLSRTRETFSLRVLLCELLPQATARSPSVESFLGVRSFFQHTHFPRENRIIAQTPQDIQAYFNHPSMSRSAAGAAGGSDANWSRFCDFHLLLYVARLFDLPTSLTICDSVSKETPVDAGMEDILKSLA
ncbi:npl4 family protein [Cyclospora cayetanensis]|uniref:Npl4 family protein n=1 Tax=Cyclospora cayetanensis TaxID=88456 RepID=A0A1D3D002_9EIME|nr:npl4 family protein [Cyclospora cayetanensis]